MFSSSTLLSLCSFGLLNVAVNAVPLLNNNEGLLERQTAAPYVAGPAITTDFADPGIAYSMGIWYAFATDTVNPSENKVVNIQMATSMDFKTWSMLFQNGLQVDALPDPPTWVNTSAMNSALVWAPDPNQVDDGSWVMYFSAATNQDSTKHCIGAATAPTVMGPFSPLADPLFCPLDQGGAIDATGFRDSDGKRYVIYKVDGNSIGHGGTCKNTVDPIVSTPILMQEVGANGVSPTGPVYTLLDNAGASDDGVVEAPSMAKVGNTYYLYFSSGCYSTPDYTVSVATSQSPTGGFVRQGPVLKTGDNNLFAPGGADIYEGDGSHIVFHADQGQTADVRQLWVGEAGVNGNTVSL